MRRESSS